MEDLIKVECNVCGKLYYVNESSVPECAKPGEAFPCECPYCTEGKYAALPEDKKHK